MNKKISFLATAALALTLAGCGIASSQSQTAMYQSDPQSSSVESSHTSEASMSSLTSSTTAETSSETSAATTTDQAVETVNVTGSTWSEQESSVKQQVNDDQVQTVRASLTDVKNQQDSQADRSVKAGRLLESSASSESNASDPETKAAQKAKEQVANMDVPDQTENRIIIARTNNISVHELDQYSDAEILEARLAAENLGSDAGYSYHYLTQNYKEQAL